MALDDVEAMAAEIKRGFEKKSEEAAKAIDAVRAIAVRAVEEAKNGVELSGSLKAQADESLTVMNGLKAQLQTIEQKMARASQFEEQARLAKSLGQQFVETEAVKNFMASDAKRGRVEMALKATITSSTANAAGSAGAALEPGRVPGINMPGVRRMTIRDLLTPGTMDNSSMDYIKETGFTNSAGMVAEGATKPQTDIQLALVNTSARVIAHTAKASRQILDDVPQLQSYIDGRLRYGLAFKEEQQLLNGDGTGQNLLGIVPQATAYAAAFAPVSATAIDTVRLAALQTALAEYPANGIVMHPSDWARIELTKDAEGRYIIGNPQGTLSPTLWGLPVVATQAMTIDKVLVGAFMLGAQIFDRWAARVEIATENEDDFQKNMVTMLCEERLALAVYRGESFVYGDLGFVA